MHLTGCIISNNSATSGGGVRNLGPLSITDTTISENSAQSGGGAGLYSSGAVLVNCTFSGNMSAGNGGGIYSPDGTIDLTNCTIAANSATNLGGGIYEYMGTVNLTNCTVSENNSSQGGGIYNTQGAVNLKNTIVAANTASIGPDARGTLTSKGYNLIGNLTDATFTAKVTDQTGVPAGLDTLKNNGGPTKTMALLPGSAAIDKGISSGSTTDQRGLGRPIDGPGVNNASGGDGSDIGAYELHGASVPGCGDNVVTNNGDTGPGSLRATLAGVCANDTITFASNVASPITLTSGELAVTKPVTISGPGANLMTVQRSANASTNFSIFHISSGALDTVSGLTITKGNPNHSGGGIFIDNGFLFLDSCAVTGNTANAGAAASNGGGIATGGAGAPSADIVRSTISGNSAANDGGGVNVGNLDIDTSTISGNTAGRYGGGINASGTTRVLNSTVANNSAATGGGVRGNGTSVNLGNTIIAKNTATTTDPDFSGSFTSQEGYNLIGDTTGTTITGTTTGNQLNVDPKLDSLQDNGGPTQTHALLPGSPAIDKGNSNGAIADQRGSLRPSDRPDVPNAAGE